ncbi:MAG: hypothetical protein JXK04_02030, partial [Campylobacterales bacterium]|nr:hypothetical protein [Campylobacterales bacterium]
GFWDMARGFFRPGASVLSRPHYEEKKLFFRYYEQELDTHQKELFRAYLSFPHLSLEKRLATLLRHDFSIGGHRKILILKTLLRKPLV